MNWDFMAQKIAKAHRPVKVLNLFAYTGGATLACAQAGAAVTHVDASKGMVHWARENAKLSGLEEKPIRWLVDDCEKFVEREIRRGNQYDGIVMDPPSYGRGPGGEIWKLEEKIYHLVERCGLLLREDALFFLLNSYTTGLSPSVMAYLLGSVIQPRLGGSVSADEIGLSVEQSDWFCPAAPLPSAERLNFNWKQRFCFESFNSLSDGCLNIPGGSSPPSGAQHLDLTVEQGEFLAILGQNGSGKSTLAKLLNAILTPTGGVCTVCDLIQLRKKTCMRSAAG